MPTATSGAWRSATTGSARMTRDEASRIGARAIWLLMAIEAGDIDPHGVNAPALVAGSTTDARLAIAILRGEALP